VAIDGLEVLQSGSVTLVAFDPSWLGVYADQIGGGQVAPHTPGEALTNSNASAVLDGPEFDNCSGQSLPSGNAGYASSTCSVIRFSQLDAARGVQLAGSNPGQGVTISVVNGQAVATPGDAPAPGASVAVQLWPPLVSGGVIVASDDGSNATAEQRAALVILGDGRLAFASGAADMVGFANALINAGATDAGYTDGGGSGALWLSDGTTYGANPPRRVATWLTAAPPGTLASATPIGWVDVLVGALVVVLAAGAVYVATRPAPAPTRRTSTARRTR